MKTMHQNSPVDRRTFLKGAGVSLALPFMDSLGWAANTKAAAKAPVRLAFMYMPHGVIMDQFWPKDQEAFLNAAPPILKSMKPVMNQCLMMKGISGVPIAPFNGAPHALELSTWLTGRLPDPDTRGRVNISISADQIMANYVGAHTLLPSLELATMPQTWKENQEGLHEGYYNHCSYRSPTQPVPAETDPRNVLNRLFGKRGEEGKVTQTNPLDRQMLDRVLGGARDLQTAALSLAPTAMGAPSAPDAIWQAANIPAPPATSRALQGSSPTAGHSNVHCVPDEPKSMGSSRSSVSSSMTAGTSAASSVAGRRVHLVTRGGPCKAVHESNTSERRFMFAATDLRVPRRNRFDSTD